MENLFPREGRDDGTKGRGRKETDERIIKRKKGKRKENTGSKSGQAARTNRDRAVSLQKIRHCFHFSPAAF